MDRRGEITDDDRRVAAERSGLPEAAVYGISTFYDDLLAAARRAPRARLHRHGVLRRDRRRARRRAPRRARPRARRARRGRLGLARRDRLPRLLPRVARGPRRRRRSTPGPARSSALLAGATAPRARAGARRACSTSRCSRARRLVRPAPRARRELTPEALLEEVKEADVRGRGGAGFPAGTKWEFARGAQRRAQVHRRQRRRGRSRLLHRQVPDGGQPGAAARGHGARGLRGRRRPRLRAHALGVPALEARAGRGRSSARAPPACSASDILGSPFSFDVTIVEGAGSYVVGEETALLGCLQGLRGAVSARPPFPAQRGVHGMPTVVNNVETLCNIPFIARARRRRRTARSAPRTRRRAPSSSASTSASPGPASTRSRSA